MGEIVVKESVRYRAKDANRVDVVSAVQTKVPVPDTEAWAEAQAEEARSTLRAELEAERVMHETALEQRRQEFESALRQRVADVDREIEERRVAALGAEESRTFITPELPAGDASASEENGDEVKQNPVAEVVTDPEAAVDAVEGGEAETKVIDPTTTKVRQPSTTKRGSSAK